MEFTYTFRSHHPECLLLWWLNWTWFCNWKPRHRICLSPYHLKPCYGPAGLRTMSSSLRQCSCRAQGLPVRIRRDSGIPCVLFWEPGALLGFFYLLLPEASREFIVPRPFPPFQSEESQPHKPYHMLPSSSALK